MPDDMPPGVHVPCETGNGGVTLEPGYERRGKRIMVLTADDGLSDDVTVYLDLDGVRALRRGLENAERVMMRRRT